MDSMAYPIFSIVSAFIRLGFNTYMVPAYAKLANSVSLIAFSIELAYITHYGILMVLQKSSENVENPNLRELIYHAVTIIVVLFLLKADTTPLDALMALRTMVIGSFTGDYKTPGGEQANLWLGLMDAAVSVGSNLINSTSISTDAPKMKSTAVTLSLTSDISPQIAAGIMLLMNELMVRLGMALFPIVFYAFLYRISRNMFFTWFNLMFSATIQMGVSIILIKLAVDATAIFLAAMTALKIASEANKAAVGTFVLSELQQSVIQGGFGFTLSALLFWGPTNVASYAGNIVNNGMLKPNLGAPVTKRTAKTRASDTGKKVKARMEKSSAGK